MPIEIPAAPRTSAAAKPLPSATPPAGFVPLSSLGIPGLDSILFSHADFYRDAYDRAVRDRQEGDAGPPRAEPMPGPDESPGLEGDAGRREW